MYISICKIDSQWEFPVWCSELTPGTLWQPRGVGGRFKREGTYIYLWLIPIDIWQKPTQYCKAIIFQLKQIKKNKLYIQRVQSKDRKDIYWKVIWTLKKFFKNFHQEMAALEEINAILFSSVFLELFCDYTNKCVCVCLYFHPVFTYCSTSCFFWLAVYPANIPFGDINISLFFITAWYLIA